MRSPRHYIHRIQQALAQIYRGRELGEDIKINQGRILARLNQSLASRHLPEYEFKVFSQWGEDGIIQHLVDCIDIPHKTFIEFGVQDFSESNCRFLMMKDNWKGMVIDGSADHISHLKNSYYFWKHHLLALDAFITRDNINDLLARSGFDTDLGLLSVDIDGNDHHVLEAITGFQPRLLICEYNAVFGSKRAITVPYEADFQRTRKHHSNLYFGASLAAMTRLAQHKGYSLVGVNSNGVNAFFVRNDLMNDRLVSLTAEQAYVTSLARESRDQDGNLTFAAGEDRLTLIRGLPVVNVSTGTIEPL